MSQSGLTQTLLIQIVIEVRWEEMLTVSKNRTLRGWRDDSAVKNSGYFSRGPEFNPSTHMIAYIYKLQSRWIKCSLTCTCADKTSTYIKILKKKNKKKTRAMADDWKYCPSIVAANVHLDREFLFLSFKWSFLILLTVAAF